MANYTDESIKKRIEVLRRKRGVTASRFAKECGVDQGNFSRALNGKGGFSEVVLMKIAKATNVTFDWLLTGCGLCGADGEKAYEELNADFHGNETLDETLKNIINSSMAIDDGKKHELWDALNRVLYGSASEERNSADLSREIELKDELLRQKEEMIVKQDREIEFYRSLLKQEKD